MIPASKEATQRFDGVDVLRGLSIVSVVLLHGYLRFALEGRSLRGFLPTPLFRLLFLNGDYGVTVFFVVSGFLITHTSLHRFGTLAAVRPTVFYRIRFARIAPLLSLVLAVLSLLHLLHAPGFHINPHQSTLPRALLAALTFHLNWFEARRGYLPANWDVLWSLSVEEMFYLFFPLACVTLFRARRGLALAIALLLTLTVLAPLGRTMWAGNEIGAEKSYLGGMGSIAMGCLAALLLRRWQMREDAPSDRTLLCLAWAGAAMMFLAAPPFRWAWHVPVGKWDLDDSLLSMGTCLVILGTVKRNRRGSVWTSPIRWFGQHSYEIYLTHEFLVIWITMLALHLGGPTARGLHRGLLAWITLIFLLSAALGWAVSKFFSAPLNARLRA